MLFEMPELPWPKDALAPLISPETIDYHYGKHHRAYLSKLNEILLKDKSLQDKTLEELMVSEGTPLFNNAAQFWNHSFYWKCLRAPREDNHPEGLIAERIDDAFGNFESFQVRFAMAALGQFGSGWAWLTENSEGELKIEQSSNAGNPLVYGHKPLLTCDVWEHAYYIDYRNDRAKYVAAFWQLINWDFVASRLSK